MELSEIRKKLDVLDAELVKVISERQALIPYVAEFKVKNNVKRYQPDREKEIIEAKRKLATDNNVDPDLIEDLIKRIIEDSHRIEKEIIGE